MSGIKILLYLLSLIALLTVTLPFIKKDHWVFRIFDYPRLQKFCLIGIVGITWLVLCDEMLLIDKIILGLLTACFLHLGYLIIPYTPFGNKMIQKADKSTDKKVLSLLVSNVFQENRDYQKLLDLVKVKDPDILFVVETDQKWLDAIQSLREIYPYTIEIPKDNTYGLLFFSKLKLKHHEINYLLDDEIPSIIADVEFDDAVIRIYGLHPTPPVPQENEHSTDRDAEILLIGKMAKKHDGPCMVIGDLNDVAWSYTTKLFLKVSGLLDPRRGRGLYSTFNSKYWLLRWPLDHFFVSGDFRLVDLNVEKPIGSDHFPISISLVLSTEDNSEQLKAKASDKQLAEEKIDAGMKDQPL